uniref:Tryptophan--tRNA ligase, mitochondrial n=1 Tax=Anopheles epiroticus TaxID=199890 RepID=A0A182P6W8_9DIPT
PTPWPRKVFSGVQPTGALHIGNYLGAVKRWVELQEAGEDVTYCIVDLHSMTIPPEPDTLRHNTLQMTATLLACGIDPARATLFLQSAVPQHAELSWILGCLTTMARLTHLPQYKEKSANMKEIPLGLYLYPVLQAADIMLYKATHVPVGEDQIQQLQLAQSLARAFNNKYGRTFPFCETLVNDGSRLKSLRDPTKKMSKSDPDPKSCIMLIDTPDVVLEKVKKSVTDFKSEVTFDAKERPGVSNLITIHSLVSGKSVEEICKEAEGKNTGQYKLLVAEALIEHLRPIRERMERYTRDVGYLAGVIEEGSERARSIAEQTIDEVKEKIGVDGNSLFCEMAQSKAVAKFWITTTELLDHVLKHEKRIQMVEPTKDVRIVHRLVSDLFCRYVQLCRSLERCYDQTLQVQKRTVIQQLLEAGQARMLELRTKLQEIELSEFVYIDGTLQEQHLIPDDVQAVRPCYFPAKRPEELQTLLDARKLPPFVPLGSDTEDASSSEESEQEEETAAVGKGLMRPIVKRDRRKERLQAALNLITAHERARQARVRQTNFRLHPDRYYPKPIDEEIVDVPYEYFFRPGQFMLYPVKRTVYNWDFRMKKKDVVHFAYYTPPGWEEQAVPVVATTLPNASEIALKKQQAEEESAAEAAEAEAARRIEEAMELMKLNRAARKIQHCWRNFKALKAQRKRRYDRSKFLGLFDDYEPDVGDDVVRAVEEVRAARRDRKPEFDREFVAAIADEKARILRIRGPALLEDITDFVRAWFRQWYDETLAFDVIPEPFQGGTVLIVRGETLTPMEYLELERQKRLDKLKTADQKKKEADAKKAAKEREMEKKREEKEKLKEMAREKRAREKKEGKTYDFTEPEFITNAYLTLEETLERYRKDWAFVNEIENPYDLPIMEWITLDKFAEVHQELHAEVHSLLKSERELLQMALCKDERMKYKLPKPKKPPRAKGAKGKKRKEVPDPTADLSAESIINELVERNVLKTCRKKSFEDFIGDFNYAAFERRNRLEQDPPPGMGEVRAILQSYLYGMGPLAAPKPKSICLVGPSGYGKTLLLEAICSETGSVLLDLSVDTCAPIEPNNMAYFLQLVLRAARLLQPSVIAIEAVHRAFYKKVPDADKPLDPQKLGKHLFKLIVKQLKPEDKVLLIGTCNQPWLAKVGPLKKCFEKFLLLPRPDYGSTVLLWRYALRCFPTVPRDLDVSALAKVTVGYSAEQILRCTKEVLTIRRRMQLGRKPLQVDELLNHFLTGTPIGPQYPIADKEYDKFLKWHRKVDKLAKQRAKLMRERELLAEQMKAKAAGAKK